jgi:hypothetical protein
LTTGKQRELVWDVSKVFVKWSDRTMMNDGKAVIEAGAWR